ncbi:hypothetical protein [Streptomyces sp. NPDC021562]|uniref:hypothetical protein n=1 Tax=Streptomyces sp. NPDC021562 TaxID=3155121 RepID=UPI0033D1429E
MGDEEDYSFEGMNRAGFFAYVRTTHEKFDKPKYKVVVEQAKEQDPQSTLSTSTVSDVLRGKSFPRIETAKWLGLGIGGEQVGRDFEIAWRAARTNHYNEARDDALHAADRAQRRSADSSESWWRDIWSRRGQVTAALSTAVLSVVVALLIQFYWR